MEPPSALMEPLKVPHKLLLGPGPSNLPPEVVNALQMPSMGHMDPDMWKIMDEVKLGIQYIFQTKSPITLAISGTGHSGMEAAIINLLEPGETALIANNGIWSQRAYEIAGRCGAKVEQMVLPPGHVFDFKTIEENVIKYQPVLLYICHGESAAGLLQPLRGIGEICHKHNCLLLVDTVASISAAPFHMDKLEIDCVYAGAQKALSCPPGLAPISLNPKAWEKVKNRKTKVQSFYMDIGLLANYWGCLNEPRRYHHTIPVNEVYALREGLARVVREGIDNCVKRHLDNSLLFQEGLAKIGLNMFIKDENLRLPNINAVEVPPGVDWKAVMTYLMKHHKIEIWGGMGPTAGKVWRIGLQGYNSSESVVNKILEALKEALDVQKNNNIK